VSARSHAELSIIAQITSYCTYYDSLYYSYRMYLLYFMV